VRILKAEKSGRGLRSRGLRTYRAPLSECTPTAMPVLAEPRPPITSP